jgi:YVTN family beta-propeller protein
MISSQALSVRTSALMLLVLAAALPGCRKKDFPQYPSNYREYAYVANSGSNSVSVVDVVNVRPEREIAVGQNPVAVAASPTRNEVYVVNSGAAAGMGSLTVVNAESNTAAATIGLRRQPVSIDLSADGKFAYVANSGSNSISVVDLDARREVAAIGAGEQPVAARISPDGKSLVVANRQGNSVTVIDPVARRVRAVFEGCPGASDIVILPRSEKAFAACSSGHQALAIALARNGRPDRLETRMDVGDGPMQLALKPDGGELFVMNSLSNSISEVVTSTNDVGGAYQMGVAPNRGLVSGDNTLLYVANAGSQEVIVYSVETSKRRGTIHVGDGPAAMAFSTAGHLLFVVDRGSSDLAVVRLSSKSLFTLLPTGRRPGAITVKAFKVQ